MKTIRVASAADMPRIMDLIDMARVTMRANGNMHQWANGYPDEAAMLADISRGVCYLIVENGCAVATFSMIPGPDPTYAVIYDGKWVDSDAPYMVVHRIASTPDSHGVMTAITDFCHSHINNIRIDTHRDNTIMQHCLQRLGYAYCGIILLANGDERLAYQKILRFSH